MEQDVNILMEQYKQALISVTQNAQLPIGVVRYIFNDINNMINREYEAYLQEAAAAQRKQQEEMMKTQTSQPESESTEETEEDETIQ